MDLGAGQEEPAQPHCVMDRAPGPGEEARDVDPLRLMFQGREPLETPEQLHRVPMLTVPGGELQEAQGGIACVIRRFKQQNMHGQLSRGIGQAGESGASWLRTYLAQGITPLPHVIPSRSRSSRVR